MADELTRIRRYLQTQEIRVQWMADRSGYTLPDLEEIHVNPAREIARTLVHEAYHKLHSDWDEDRIEAETLTLVDGLTPRQVLGLARRCRGITWMKEETDDLA